MDQGIVPTRASDERRRPAHSRHDAREQVFGERALSHNSEVRCHCAGAVTGNFVWETAAREAAAHSPSQRRPRVLWERIPSLCARIPCEIR